jgi:hypothetical protein
MGLVVSSAFGIAGTLVKYSFWTSGIVIAGAGFIAYKTKPKEKTFNPIFRKYENEKDNPVKSILSTIIVAVVVSVVYKDYFFFRTAEVKFTGDSDRNSKYYVGAFQNWFLLNK